MKCAIRPEKVFLGYWESDDEKTKFAYRDLFFYVIVTGEKQEVKITKSKAFIENNNSEVMSFTFSEKCLLENAKKYARLVGWDFKGLNLTEKSKIIFGFNLVFDDFFDVKNVKVVVQGKTVSKGQIVAEALQPLIHYESKTELKLPFKGAWYAVLKIDEKGRSYRGDGLRCEDYYAFAQPILAPADGIVVQTVDGVKENVPLHPPSEEEFKHNRIQAAGNFIVIDHQNWEYSFLAHLKNGSIKVKKGEKVKRGQPIALCGYSGYATEPGLHFHLMDGPYVFRSNGLPCYFTNFKSSVLGRKVKKAPVIPRDIVKNTPTK
jgi:hypothetical protein